MLVDDHKFVVDLMKPLLESQIPDLEVIKSADDGTKAVALASELCPDLLIMDIDLPGIGCFDAAQAITQACPDTKIMFLSAHQHDEYIEQALRVGARGYVVKN
ncbi:MAG: response regulator transcription factor, partial [Planctomycetes bacterium]|nr:response regulator transcription factor [Planctomycetota bacterium]